MRNDLSDLAAFTTIAGERSFTRAAERLGVSQSALSHSLRVLAKRLGIELLARTSRNVSPAAVGDSLLLGLYIVLDITTSSDRVGTISAGYDAGIQIGEYIPRDMIAVRVSDDLRLAVFGSPAYFQTHPIPRTPGFKKSLLHCLSVQHWRLPLGI